MQDQMRLLTLSQTPHYTAERINAIATFLDTEPRSWKRSELAEVLGISVEQVPLDEVAEIELEGGEWIYRHRRAVEAVIDAAGHDLLAAAIKASANPGAAAELLGDEGPVPLSCYVSRRAAARLEQLFNEQHAEQHAAAYVWASDFGSWLSETVSMHVEQI